jgi:hypothetical protein
MLLFWTFLLISLIFNLNEARKQQPKKNEPFINRGIVDPNNGGIWRDCSKMKVWEIVGELNPNYLEFLKSLPAEYQNTFTNPDRQISVIIPEGKPFTRPGTSIDNQTVLYNILTERMFSGQEGTKKYQSYHMNHNVMCYRDNGFLYMNEAMIKGTYQGLNGMVIKLDFLLPKPPHTKTALDEKTPFSQILLAIQRTYSNFDLNRIGSYFTIFAPILGMDWESFQKKANLNTPEKRDGFLLAHIVPNDVMLNEDMTAPKILKSGLQGFTYSLLPGKVCRVNGSKILEIDHFVSIGVVHVIEKPIATIEEIINQAGSVVTDADIKQTVPQFKYESMDPLNNIEDSGIKTPQNNEELPVPCEENVDTGKNQGGLNNFGNSNDENSTVSMNMKSSNKNTLPVPPPSDGVIGGESGGGKVNPPNQSPKDQQVKTTPEKSFSENEIKEMEQLKSRWMFYSILILLIVAGAVGSCAFMYHKNSKTKKSLSATINEVPN